MSKGPAQCTSCPSGIELRRSRSFLLTMRKMLSLRLRLHDVPVAGNSNRLLHATRRGRMTRGFMVESCHPRGGCVKQERTPWDLLLSRAVVRVSAVLTVAPKIPGRSPAFRARSWPWRAETVSEEVRHFPSSWAKFATKKQHPCWAGRTGERKRPQMLSTSIKVKESLTRRIRALDIKPLLQNDRRLPH